MCMSVSTATFTLLPSTVSDTSKVGLNASCLCDFPELSPHADSIRQHASEIALFFMSFFRLPCRKVRDYYFDRLGTNSC